MGDIVQRGRQHVRSVPVRSDRTMMNELLYEIELLRAENGAWRDTFPYLKWTGACLVTNEGDAWIKAAERDKQEAIAAEREACAGQLDQRIARMEKRANKIFKGIRGNPDDNLELRILNEQIEVLQEEAQAIRERGEG